MILPFVSQAFLGFMLFSNHGGNDLAPSEQLSDKLYPSVITCQAEASLSGEPDAVCGMVIDHSAVSVYEELGMEREWSM